VVPEFTFELLEKDACKGVIRSALYQGPWLIVDKGYLKWSTTVPPFKLTSLEEERRWSQWLESLQKDAVCTFGILKGRWRISKTGIQLECVEVADNIFKTCCALHNWLLEIDGLDREWKGVNGQQEASDVLRYAPAALQRLHANPTALDLSTMGAENNEAADAERIMDANNYVDEVAVDESESVRVVRNLSLNYFCKKLIKHFNILF